MFSKNFTNIIIFTLYFSLLFGIYINEDLIGGALSDYKGHYHITERFRDNFLYTLNNYDELGHRHSPIFYFLRSIIPGVEIIERLFFLHLYLIIPLFLYKCLKLKYKNKDKKNLKLLSSSILLLPTFRSYSIWPDPHLLGFLFFMISIYYFIKFKNNNFIFKFAILNTFFLSLSAYASPNFGVFVIYFLYQYLTEFKFNKKFIYILLINFLLSIPFFYYLFYLDINFLFNNNGWDIGNNFFSIKNISNKIIIISSIFLFFLIPLIEIKKIINSNIFKLKIKPLLIILFVFFVSCYFFDFNETFKLTNSGGGIFYNLSNYLFNNDYLLYLICFLSCFLFSNIFNKNLNNILIFICILLSNPQLTIWHANHSPTILILLLLLFNIDFLKDKFNLKDIFQIFLYFVLYIFMNLIKIVLI